MTLLQDLPPTPALRNLPQVPTTFGELTPVGPVTWVTEKRDVEHLRECLQICQVCVFDLETTGLDEFATRGGPTNNGYPARIPLAGFTLPLRDGIEPTSWVVPLSHPESPWLGQWQALFTDLINLVWTRRKPVVGHNVKFDVRWTAAHTGIDLASLICWDTMVGAHLLDENQSTKLKERAPRVFGVPRWDDFDLSTPGAADRVPLFELGEYAVRDTFWTWKLFDRQRRMTFAAPDTDPRDAWESEEVENAKLGRLATRCAMPTVASLAKMEQRGIKLDEQACRQELEAELTESASVLDRMAERYGMDREQASSHSTARWFQEWTARACQADDLRIIAYTGNNNPQWSKAVLTRLAREGAEAAQLVLDARQHSKKAEFLSSWLEHMSPDGALHSTYHAGRVVTGRLSSSDVNAQQITKKLRPMFIPRPGFVMVDIDYSQIEMRVGAHVSACRPMISAFQEGRDLHRMLAGVITGKIPADIDADERQQGKAGNFGLLFGMSVPGLIEYADNVYGVVFDEPEAARVHEAFFTTWDGIRAWHQKSVSRAQRYGQVVSPIGRVRRLPNISSPIEYYRGQAERQAINSPVQGFASDLMQTATASITGVLPGHQAVAGAFPVATVHDSLVLEIDENDWERITDACMDRMIGLNRELKAMDCDFQVPLEANATCGTRWGLTDVGERSSTS